MKTQTLIVALILQFSLPIIAGPGTTDGDSTPDFLDICVSQPLAPNPIGCDTDNDGYGNACDGDLNNDGIVSGVDFNTPGPDNDFLDAFVSGSDPNGIGADINCDGVVSGSDFNNPSLPDFLEFFLSGTLGPSGLACAGTVPCP